MPFVVPLHMLHISTITVTPLENPGIYLGGDSASCMGSFKCISHLYDGMYECLVYGAWSMGARCKAQCPIPSYLWTSNIQPTPSFTYMINC